MITVGQGRPWNGLQGPFRAHPLAEPTTTFQHPSQGIEYTQPPEAPSVWMSEPYLSPETWTREQVRMWLERCVSDYGLDEDLPDKFPMNGRGLFMLTKDDFRQRLPDAGDVLFNAFRALIFRQSGSIPTRLTSTGPCHWERNTTSEPSSVFRPDPCSCINTWMSSPGFKQEDHFAINSSSNRSICDPMESALIGEILPAENEPLNLTVAKNEREAFLLSHPFSEITNPDRNNNMSECKSFNRGHQLTMNHPPPLLAMSYDNQTQFTTTTTPPVSSLSPALLIKLPSSSPSSLTTTPPLPLSPRHSHARDFHALLNFGTSLTSSSFLSLSSSSSPSLLSSALSSPHLLHDMSIVPKYLVPSPALMNFASSPRHRSNRFHTAVGQLSSMEEKSWHEPSQVTSTIPVAPKVHRMNLSTSDRLLWKFLAELLNCPTVRCVSWEDRQKLTFRIVDPDELAELWGVEKCKPGMTYEKLSRALRYYYKMNILAKIPGKRLTYRFITSPQFIKKGKRGAKPGIPHKRRNPASKTQNQDSLAKAAKQQSDNGSL